MSRTPRRSSRRPATVARSPHRPVERLEDRRLLSAVITTLAQFAGTSNGQYPLSGLVADASGNLYGTTSAGGANGLGTVFELPVGSSAPQTLVDFNGTDGAEPYASTLVFDKAGNLYGTTYAGGNGYTTGDTGNGTVFELPAATRHLTTLVTFTGTTGATLGAAPQSALTIDSAGDLFGTTYGGGTSSGRGTVFEITAGGTFQSLFSFDGRPHGAGPLTGMAADAAGNLYGATLGGGANNLGAVFEVSAGTHAVSLVASFDASTGTNSFGGIAIDAAGNLYGTTESNGGAGDFGTVYEVPANAARPATPVVLAAFDGTGGSATPLSGVILDRAGNLWGTADGNSVTDLGTVYEVAAGSHVLTTVAAFPTKADGAYPQAGLIADASGNLYGTTKKGGAADLGTVFEVSNSGFVVPTVTVAPVGVQSATAGVAQTFALGTFSQAYATAPYTVDISWGDGSSDAKFAAAAPGPITSQAHLYARSGNQTVTETVTDSAGHTGTASFTVTVQAPPTTILTHVYDDADQTGTSTTPVPGRVVYIDLNGDGLLESNEPSAVTGPDGSAPVPLTSVTGSTCLVAEVVPDGVQQTYPAVAEVSVTTANPGVVNFGNLTLAPPPASVVTAPLFTKYALANLPSSPTATGVARAVSEPDGTLVVVGTGPAGPYADRYFPDGELDLQFGVDGVTLTNGTSGTQGLLAATATGVAVQPDGDVVVVGTGVTAAGAAASFVTRLLADGSVDSSFGSVTTAFDADGIRGVAQMVDGSLLAFGTANVTGGTAPALLDLSGDTGRAVAAFGTNGRATAPSADLGSTLEGPAVVTPAGTVDLVASDGALVTFADTGAVTARVALSLGFAPAALAVQPQDGKVLVGGASGETVSVARFNTNGTPDAAFGTGGTASTTLGTGGAAGVGDVGLLADGTVLLTGTDYAAGATAGQCFCQGYDPATGAATFGVGTADVPVVPSDVARSNATLPSGATLGAGLVLPSGFLPTVTATSAADVALPAIIHVGGVTLGHVTLTLGQSVADINVEQTPPAVGAFSASPITAASSSPEMLSVAFTDRVALSLSSFHTGNLTVTLPNSTASVLATFVGFDPATFSSTSLTAQYEIPAVHGAWTSTDDGSYAVSLAAGQVKNTARAAPAVSGLGSFVVSIAAPGVSGSLATVPTVSTPGTATVSLTVTYSSTAGAMSAASIGTADLTVTGPSGTPLTVTAAAAGTAVGDTLPVTYTVAAPAGSFGPADAGAYVVALVAGQVTDTAGNAAAAATLGSFTVGVGQTATRSTVAAVTTLGRTGNVVNFTAAIAPADGTSASGVGGSATLYCNGTEMLGTATVIGGTASFSTAALPGGTDAVTVVYAGDGTHAASTSAPLTVTVAAPAAGAPILTPSLAGTVLPIALVGGAKHRLSVPVTIINSGTGPLTRGTVTITLYASTDGALDSSDAPIAPAFLRTMSLKAGATKKVTMALPGLLASLANGTYYLLAQVSDPSGFAQTAATSSTVTVAAPFVRPAVSVTRLTGTTTAIVAGLKTRAAALLSLTNSGNVTLAGTVSLSLYLTASTTTGTVDALPADAARVTAVSRRLSIPAGKTKAFSVPLGKIPSVAAGSYQLALALTTPAANGTSPVTVIVVDSTVITIGA